MVELCYPILVRLIHKAEPVPLYADLVFSPASTLAADMSMGIARRGLNLRVAEALADHRQHHAA